MRDIEEAVILKIQTYDGDIEIPFLSLESLDNFTVRYKDKGDLLTGVLSMLDLNIDRKRIGEVYVYYEYVRKDKVRRKNAKVKYRDDNFDKNTLSGYLKEFLKKDHSKIRECGVRKIRSKGMYDFIAGARDILDYEIDYAVDRYFEGAPYGIYRKIYFFLRDYNVRVNKKRVVRETDATIKRNLSSFHSEDDYVQSLLSGVKTEEDFERVYEELSRMDLEELRTKLLNPHYGLFDGVGNDKPYTLEDLYDLELYTGMSIDDLCGCVYRGMRKGSKK